MIVPFYSSRTLGREHVLVRELAHGLAVYIGKDGRLATIGTRGVRPGDGSGGLIIHLSVTLEANGSVRMFPDTLVEPPFHNLDRTSLAPDALFDILVATLRDAGRLAPF